MFDDKKISTIATSWENHRQQCKQRSERLHCMERDGAVSRAATELRRLCDDLEQYCWQLWDGRTSQWDGMRRSNERIESSLNTSCQHPAAVPFTLSTVFEVQSNIQNRGLFRGQWICIFCINLLQTTKQLLQNLILNFYSQVKVLTELDHQQVGRWWAQDTQDYDREATKLGDCRVHMPPRFRVRRY